MKFKELPSQEYLKECLDYDMDAGVFTWKIRPVNHFRTTRGMNIFNTQFSGKSAGCIRENGKYLSIGINDFDYLAHRIAWKIVTGNDPVCQIDHKNKNKLDYAWTNLREASHSENLCNMKMHKDNKSGFKGVSLCKKSGKYVSEIMHNRKRIRKGGFNTAIEAHKYYCDLSEQMHKDFSNFGYL